MLRFIETAIGAVINKLNSPPKKTYAATAAAIIAPRYDIKVWIENEQVNVTVALPNQPAPIYVMRTTDIMSLEGGDNVAAFSADKWAIVFKLTTGVIPKHDHQHVFLSIKAKLSEVLDTKKLGLLAVGELTNETDGARLKFAGDVNKTVALLRLSPYN